MVKTSQTSSLIPWQQGHCFEIENNDPLIKENILPQAGFYFLISQDCDIARAPDTEPYVEVILATTPESYNKIFSKGKNPRRLHIQLADKCFEFFAYNKFRLEKKNLESRSPDKKYAINTHELVTWLIKRYSRAAFPDAFNSRLNKNSNTKKIIEKNLNNNSYGLWINLNPHDKELPENISYKLDITLLIDQDYYNSSMSDQLETIVHTIENCPGIEVINYNIITRNELTLYEFNQLKKWDFDYLSGADGETLD